MTDRNQRIIVIGGGHNGLTCAAYLAKAGKEVTVLEANEQVGGAAVTREFTDGFRVSAGAHLLYALDRGIASDLALETHGLKYAAQDLYTIALDAKGQYLSLADGMLGGPGVVDEDRVAMAAYHREMNAFAEIIWDLKDKVPPRLGTSDRSDLFALGKLGLQIRRLGKKNMREFLRIAGINIFDVLQERFQGDLLKGALSLDGTLGTFLGPRSNNSVFTALHRFNQGRDYDLPQGGMGAVSDALAASARASGALIRTESRVASIDLDNGTLKGVTLQSGEVLEADAVLSSADPKTTFQQLLGFRHLEAGFANRVHNIRTRGCVAKLHLALDGLPEFAGLDETQAGNRLLIAPDLTYVEHAFNHAKYGEFSERPTMEISIPTVQDPRLAPDGKHVLSANVQWAPYNLKGGWEDGRAPFVERCMNVLEDYAPGIGKQVVHSELLTPVDLEAQFGMTGGDWNHGELALDSFLMLRPVPGAAQYSTPIPGLYLCGAGAHPGGGVMGCAGRNAANALINK